MVKVGLIEADAALRDEPGCWVFDIAVDADEPEKGLFYEICDGENAFRQHRRTAHYEAFFGGIENLSINWTKARYWRQS